MIAGDEPCLQGHFPGNPLVPGVVILERVAEQIARRDGQARAPSRIDAVKFLSPLRPGEPMTIEVQATDFRTVRFTCSVGARCVATGVMTMRRGPL